MTKKFLNHCLRHFATISKNLSLKKFNKVYTINDVCKTINDKKNSKKNLFFIVFIPHEYNKQYGHFIFLFKKRSQIFYIDSFGLNCYNKKLLSCMKKNGKYFFNDSQIQSINSTHCGLFSLLFFIHFSLNSNLKLNFEKENLNKNDDLCIMYLKKYIRKYIS